MCMPHYMFLLSTVAFRNNLISKWYEVKCQVLSLGFNSEPLTMSNLPALGKRWVELVTIYFRRINKLYVLLFNSSIHFVHHPNAVVNGVILNNYLPSSKELFGKNGERERDGVKLEMPFFRISTNFTGGENCIDLIKNNFFVQTQFFI